MGATIANTDTAEPARLASSGRAVKVALTGRQRAVLEGRLGPRGPLRTLRQIGDELGITKERVRQIEAAAIRKLGIAAARRAAGGQVTDSVLADLERYGAILGLVSGEAGASTTAIRPALGPVFVSFQEARSYARSLGLSTARQWWRWSKSGERPADVPSNPHKAYRAAGWAGWADFLGHRAVDRFLPFEQARSYARTLGLRSSVQWFRLSRNRGRPANIPSHPDAVYREAGWAGWPDFLGYERSQPGRGPRPNELTYALHT